MPADNAMNLYLAEVLVAMQDYLDKHMGAAAPKAVGLEQTAPLRFSLSVEPKRPVKDQV